jgi:hypothetical protein
MLTMGGFGYACAVVLAGVFMAGGAAKLAWRRETRANFTQLGLPRPDVLAVGVPIVELVLAVLLLAFPVVGGVLSLLALAVFTAVLAHLLRGGTRAPCGCIGSPRDATPLSGRAIVRNGGLAALAVAALCAEPNLPSAPEIALTAFVVAAGWIAINFGERPRRSEMA